MNDSSSPNTIETRLTNALPHSEVLRLLIHDLRTPLNVIGLALRLLADSSDSEMMREVEFAESSVQQMVRILKLVGELARAVDPKTLAASVRVNVREWVQGVVASVAQEVGVVVNFEESLPESVELHEQLAKSAVRLAYENAMAASEENRVSVSCWGGARAGVLRSIRQNRRRRPPAMNWLKLESVLRNCSGRPNLDLGWTWLPPPGL